MLICSNIDPQYPERKFIMGLIQEPPHFPLKLSFLWELNCAGQ